MSGFEIVGVVLGVVPLLIAAFEGYQKLNKKRKIISRTYIYIGMMIRALKQQQTFIQGDVEIVLRNAQVSDALIERMDYGSLETLLLDDEVRDEVQTFLGRNYAAYIDILAECEQTLLRIARKIPIFTQGSLSEVLKANQHLGHAGNDVWKRIKFSISSDELNQAITDLDSASTKLSRLGQQSQQVRQAILTASPKTKSAAMLLRNVQTRAHMLHRAISQCWQSQCHDAHKVLLHLESRVDESKKAVRQLRPVKSKEIVFQLTLQGDGSLQRQFLYVCNVRSIDDDELCDTQNISSPRRVTFQVTTTIVSNTKKPKVDDVCCVVDQFRQQQSLLELYMTGSGSLHYDSLPLGAGQSLAGWRSQISKLSLNYIINSNSVAFPLKARIKVAAVVASSMLQLYATPWCTSLKKKEIFFSADIQGDIDYQHPFICRSFDKLSLQRTSSNPTDGETELLELGILIMELWKRESIATFAQKQSIPLDSSTDLRQSVAGVWLARLEDEMVSPVYDAALRCVKCRFDASVIDLSDLKLNQSIYELIVRPLLDSCGH